MSSVEDNNMGPVEPADDEIHKYMTEVVKHAAIHKLHELHVNHAIHPLTPEMKQEHIDNFRAVLYAKEHVSYGTNYFVKVQISPDQYIHVRFHKQAHHDVVDFYSLHQTYRGPHPTCLWSLEEPLVYFNI